MDPTDLTGDPSEFLAIMALDGDAAETPPPDAADDASLAAAADDAAAVEEPSEPDDLTPDERVAAMLAEGIEDAEPDEDATASMADEDAAEADLDLDTLTPAQLRELAEEALRLRGENADRDLSTVQREAEAAVDAARNAMRGRIDAAFQREVLAVSEAHYRRLIDEKIRDVIKDANAQTRLEPDAYIEQYGGPAVQHIQAAQRQWEQSQRVAWQPRANELLTEAGENARKQHPGIRRLYAAWLANEHTLPAKAVDELLKEPDIDRMPERAKELVAYRNALLAVKRTGSQQTREEAARRVAATRTTPPGTGRAKSATITPIKGEEREWLAMRRATSA